MTRFPAAVVAAMTVAFPACGVSASAENPTMPAPGIPARAETPEPAPALELRIAALVEARAAGWPAIEPEAAIDTHALSWRRKVWLGSSPSMPAGSPAVKRALGLALAGVPVADRKRTLKVLDAVGRWVSASVAEDAGPLGTPSGWRPAGEVLASGRGNPFERVRVLVAMLRAAGIPARPSFNGVPVVVLFAAPVAGSPAGEWTVWDPLHPSASFGRLPVGWMPLRAGEVPLVETEPAGVPCRPAVEVRRFAGRDEAARSWETVGRLGAFPSNPAEVIAADAVEWWEIWITTIAFDADPGAVTVRVPLPFVPELKTGTRDQSVWLSDPGRLRGARPWSETDQRLGGLLHGLAVRIGKAK